MRIVLLCALEIGLSWSAAASGPAATPALDSAAPGDQPRVVINEIMYHPPGDLDDLQYLELHNPGGAPVALDGWAFTKGIKFRFGPDARLEGGGFLVLCRNAERFREFYDASVGGVFDSTIRRKGERIELSDASGQVVDSVKFNDNPPWPAGADGASGSLERICPTANGDDPANWVSSPLSEDREKPAGSPGRPNAAVAIRLPPVISEVRFSPVIAAPGESITVEAEVRDSESVADVVLRYRVAGPGYEKEELSVPMTRVSAQRYRGTLPGQAAGQLIRFRVRAVGEGGVQRDSPAETEPRPAYSAYVQGPVEAAKVAVGWVVLTTEHEGNAAQPRGAAFPPFPDTFRFDGPSGPEGPGGFPGGPPPPEMRESPPGFAVPPGGVGVGVGVGGSPRPPAGGPRGGGGERMGPGGPRGGFPFRGGGRRMGGFDLRAMFGGPPAPPGSHRSAFVYYDPVSETTELYDFVQVTPRKGGQKVRFQKDQPLRGMSTINLIFEGTTAVVVEALAYEVYRRAGLPSLQCWPVRLWQNGRPVGYQLLVEQPNRAFLKRNRLRDDGNLYKLIWYGDGLIGQHEKKTHERGGHDDLVALVEALDQASGEAQWEVIRANFDIDEVAGYFAVNTVLSHWDGFFNNYFAYHDVHGTGRWTLYPWDQDSTWGLRAMGARGRVFYDMPLTFGMNGDQPPTTGGWGMGWWRQPGWFSGPLLAQPDFRRVFLARTRRILETVYTEEVMNPVLDDLEERLVPEARFRARTVGRDPDGAEQELRSTLEGCREHLRRRREFLLAQAEIVAVGDRPSPAPESASQP